jgi:hypothetical protein
VKMNTIKKISWVLLTFTVFGLSSCGRGTPTTDPSMAYTQIWLTVQAAQTQTASVVSPTSTLTNTPTSSPTLQITITPLISNTPLPTVASLTPVTISTLPAAQGTPVDNASFVRDVTIPDGYIAVPGETVDKIWEIKNDGPSNWDQDYYLRFGWGGDGTNWRTVFGTAVPVVVEPGDTLQIGVKLKCPEEAGEYVGVFRMQNDKGAFFGPTLTIDVVVK